MKILGRVVSTKPITLSRAAKLISRFAAVENGSSPAVSHYLQRAADAFNHLLQSQEKRSNRNNLDTKITQTSQINDAAEATAMKKKKKGRSSEAILDSENIHSENVNVVRESENEITNDGDMPPKKKKRKRGGDASLDSTEKVSEDLVRETGKAIVNDGDSTEAPARRKKKKKKNGES